MSSGVRHVVHTVSDSRISLQAAVKELGTSSTGTTTHKRPKGESDPNISELSTKQRDIRLRILNTKAEVEKKLTLKKREKHLTSPNQRVSE